MIDPAQIEQWLPIVKAQPHGVEEPHAPRVWQRQLPFVFSNKGACLQGARDNPSLIALKRATIAVIAAILGPASRHLFWLGQGRLSGLAKKSCDTISRIENGRKANG